MKERDLSLRISSTVAPMLHFFHSVELQKSVTRDAIVINSIGEMQYGQMSNARYVPITQAMTQREGVDRTSFDDLNR